MRLKKYLSITSTVFILAGLTFVHTSASTASTSGYPVVAAVGDIACSPSSSSFKAGLGTATACRQKYVANLIRSQNPDKFLALGDTQYDSGALSDYMKSYDLAFSSLDPITLPVVGNHEYKTANASGFASYFGISSPYRYSTDIGSWHVIVLNANCGKIGGCGTKSAQTKWLEADLANNSAQCTLVAWHQPLYVTGNHNGARGMSATWKVLYQNNVDVVLNGHEHSYQRFVPINPNTNSADNSRGITEFIVGTGGKSHYTATSTSPLLAYDDNKDYGASFFTLMDGSYSYKFMTENGAVMDSGTSNCH